MAGSPLLLRRRRRLNKPRRTAKAKRGFWAARSKPSALFGLGVAPSRAHNRNVKTTKTQHRFMLRPGRPCGTTAEYHTTTVPARCIWQSSSVRSLHQGSSTAAGNQVAVVQFDVGTPQAFGDESIGARAACDRPTRIAGLPIRSGSSSSWRMAREDTRAAGSSVSPAPRPAAARCPTQECQSSSGGPRARAPLPGDRRGRR